MKTAALIFFVLTSFNFAVAKEPLDTVNFTKPKPGHTGVVGKDILRIIGTVFSVQDDGVLLLNWENFTLEPYGTHGGSTGYDEFIFIACDSSKMVDGDKFDSVVYPAGRVKMGGSTMHLYADSSKLALKLIAEKAKK